MRFLRPMESTDNAYFTTEDSENGTVVKWGFDGKMPYPWNVMGLFMDMEDNLSTGVESALVALDSETTVLWPRSTITIAERERENEQLCYGGISRKTCYIAN